MSIQKIALVTGGSSGIGQATALRLAERGAGVVITFNGNPDGADETVKMIGDGGGDALALPLDLAAEVTPGAFGEFAARVGEEIAVRFRRPQLDWLVNNAGFGQMSMFEDTTEELFDTFYRVHLRGPYFLTQALLPLLTDGGAIVNVTSGSTLSHALTPGYSGYATMKGGLTVLTRYLAKELAPRGIRVNSVAPGSTRTRIAGDAFAHHPEVIGPLAEQTALGRIGEPDDVGRVVASLLSDDWAWVTGENIEVSGGFML